MLTKYCDSCTARLRRNLNIFMIFGLSLTLFSVGARADTWDDNFHLLGIDGMALAGITMYGDLVVGGNFASAGRQVVHNIARWDGDSWHRIGSGLDGIVRDLIAWEGDLIACGNFTRAGEELVNHVARFDGSQWRSMGGGLPSTQMALAVFEGQLWCGEWRYDGVAWTRAFEVDALILDLIVHEGRLVAGGRFQTVAGLPAPYVVAWDGAQIIPLPGQPHPIADLEIVGGQLYTLVADAYGAADPVRVWDGAGWPALAGLPEDYWSWYQKLVNDAGQLRLLKIVSPGIPPIWWSDIGTWNGAGWQWLAETYNSASVSSFFPYDGDLVLSGRFSLLGETIAHGIALLGNDGEQAMGDGGQGFGGSWGSDVSDICATPDGVAVGGTFLTAGQVVTGAAALWDGLAWQPRNAGAYNIVQLAWHAGQLHAFFWAGDVISVNHMFWTGGDWEETYGFPPAGNLPFDAISYNGLLIAAADDLQDWTVPGEPEVFADLTGGSSLCLAEWNGQLAVGGYFESVAGVPAASIALYADGIWSEPGGGADGSVQALAVHGGQLAAAGAFNFAGMTPARNVALYDGESWRPFGDGLADEVMTLASYKGYLYAGGSFESVAGSTGGHLARWNGRQWELVGGGTDGTVVDLVVYDDKLHIAGEFSVAGGMPAARFAIWNGDSILDVPSPFSAAVQLSPPAPNPFNPRTTIHFALAHDTHVRLAVYDLRGRRIATMIDGAQSAGDHTITWDARDAAGRRLAAGSYLLRLDAAGLIRTAKLTLVE